MGAKSPDPVLPRLVVGLGNPGRRYAATHHNLGFMVLDECARADGFRLRAASQAQVAQHEGVHYMKPLTFMNLSGEAVGPYCRYHRIPPEEVLVVCDDLDLPPRAIRIRPGGGSGGHNGLKSLIQALGTERFPRVRIGIGRPSEPGMGTIDFVLARLPKPERELWDQTIRTAAEAVAVMCRDGVDAAMNRFNGASVP